MWSQDGTFPQRCPSTPSSEAGHYDGPALAQPGGPGTSNPLLAPPLPSAEHFGQGVRLLPSGEPPNTGEAAHLPTSPTQQVLPNVERCRFASRRVDGMGLPSTSASSLPGVGALREPVRSYGLRHLSRWVGDLLSPGGGEGRWWGGIHEH